MGDSDGVAKLCETMQQMLTRLIEQSQSKTSVGSEALKTLEPNPVKLTGPGDFFSWSRNALLILESHGLQRFLKEDEKKPGDVTQEQWDQNTKRVMVWLLGSMEKSVREQVEGFQTAAEVWVSIEKQFSGKSNKMQVCRILHELRNIKQDKKSVTEYAGEIKKLYRDLEYFRPFKAHDPRDVPLLREWFEPILVQAFLEGLNPEFNFRAQLIWSSDWSTLDQTIASVLEEETRLANQDVVAPVYGENRAALMHTQSSTVAANDHANAMKFDPKKKTTKICDYCKKPGHIKRNCFDLVGYPPGWQQKHVNKFNLGNSGEKKQDRVHLVTSSKDLPQVDAQALEEFKAKLMAATADGPSEASSSHNGKGTKVWKNSWDWD